MDRSTRAALQRPRAIFEAAVVANKRISNLNERVTAATDLVELMEELAGLARQNRRAVIKQAWEESGETMKDFGLEFGMSRQRVWKIAQEEVEVHEHS